MARAKKKDSKGVAGVRRRRQPCDGCGVDIDLDSESFIIFLDGKFVHPHRVDGTWPCLNQKEIPDFDQL